MSRPRLLDLFCCAGGAGMGYHHAGFDVTGVDINPQPRYPFEFHQGDALEFLRKYGHEFDAIHASPPCQRFTAYRRRGAGVGDGYADLVADTREALIEVGRPYVIENVPGAPLERPVTYCGSSFGLDVRRHRNFESNIHLDAPACDHSWQTPRFPPATNRTNLRRTVEVGVWRIPLATQQKAMGIDWMQLRELSEAIPAGVHRAHRPPTHQPPHHPGSRMTYLLDRLPDVALVAAIGLAVYTILGALLLITAQAAGIRRTVPWPRFLLASAVMFAIWVLIR